MVEEEEGRSTRRMSKGLPLLLLPPSLLSHVAQRCVLPSQVVYTDVCKHFLRGVVVWYKLPWEAP